jgi:hypothetical protein
MSSVLRYVDQLVKETSPADDVPRLEMQEGGAVEIKEDVSKSFKKILNQRGKVSISDLTKDTGYSKPTVYKYLEERQRSKLIGQPSPFKDKITKQVNQIVNDVSKSKKPLIEASPSKIFEKIYNKKFNIKTDNIGVIRNILNENSNWPKIREAVTNTSTRVGAGNKVFEKVKLKDFDKVFTKAIKQRGIPRAGTVEEFILRDLKRHIDQGGKKFQFAKNNTFDKGFKGLKIKDIKEGDVIDFNSIKKNDARFKEYKNVFNDIKKLKLTPYTNPVTKQQTTLLEGLQKATGVQAPLNIQHNKGVSVDPLKNLSIQTYKANIGAKMVETPEQAKKLGVQTTVKGGKKVVGPKLSFENQVDRLTKFSDRMIKGGGLRTVKTPTETLMKKAAQSSGPTLGMNLGFLPALKTAGEVIGSPAAALAFATQTVRENLRKGESLPAALADKFVGAELLAPGAISRFAPGVMKGILGLGKVARSFTPIGAGLTAAGVAKDVIRESRRRAALSDEERLEEDLKAQEEFDETMIGAAGGGLLKQAGDRSGKPPEAGPVSDGGGLPYIFNRVKNV